MHSCRFVCILLAAAFICAVPAQAGETVTEDALSQQTQRIAKQLRCVKCQSQSVDESNADIARDMRAMIREQLRQGKTEKEILDYFKTRYGDYVLMEPEFSGAGRVIWLLPLLLL